MEMKTLHLLFSIVFIGCFFSFSAYAQSSIWATYFGKSLEAREKGDLQTAEKLLRMALAEAENSVKNREEKADNMLCDTLGTLSAVLGEQGKHLEAEDFARRALKVADVIYKESDPDYSRILNNLGLALSNLKKYAEAEEIHRRVMRIREKYEPTPKRNLRVSILNLGLVYFQQEKYFEAKPLFNQVVDFYFSLPSEELNSEDISTLLTAMNNVVVTEEKLEEFDEALKHNQSILTFIEVSEGKNSPFLIDYLKIRARLLRSKKQPLKATHVENRIKNIKRLNGIK